MSIDPADKLIAAHPLVFKGETPRWCDLPAGWYERVDRLCTELENELSEDDLRQLRVPQFREKRASLHFYFSLGTEEGASFDRVRGLISEARSDCSKLCQVCGEPGEVPANWIEVLCERHRQEMIDRVNDAK